MLNLSVLPPTKKKVWEAYYSKDDTRGMAKQLMVDTMGMTHAFDPISAKARSRDAIISAYILPVWTKGGAEKMRRKTVRLLGFYRMEP